MENISRFVASAAEPIGVKDRAVLEGTRHSSVNGFRSVVGVFGLGVNTRLKGSASDGPTNFQNNLPRPDFSFAAAGAY